MQNQVNSTKSPPRRVEVVPYNPAWPRMFAIEADLIKQTLGCHCADIHHIGSTSVLGLSAKRNLDILCIVDKLSAGLGLQALGYVFKGELNIPLRAYFSKKTSTAKVNLHMVEPDHGFIPLNLCFRDYLREHEEARLEYASLKHKLLKEPKSQQKSTPYFTDYTLGKDCFIKSILKKAGFKDFHVNFCAHDNEWAAYHRIQEGQIFRPDGIVYNRNHPIPTTPNHRYFVLYQGTTIVAAAHVELLNLMEAVVRWLASDEPYKDLGYDAYMTKFLTRYPALLPAVTVDSKR